MAMWAEDAAESRPEPQRDVTPIPRPPGRHRATQAQWTLLRRHFEFAACVHCGHRYQALHHIAFRSEGGGDVIENLAPLTNDCHDLFHSHGPGWEQVAASIRQYVMVDPHRRQYAENVLGERFNKRYPALPNTDPRFEKDFRVLYPPLEPLDKDIP